MDHHRYLLLLLLLLASAAILTTAVPSVSGAVMFVMGDSSVSCGGNTFFSPLFPTASNSSRYSNFRIRSCPRLLHDLVGEKMGLSQVPPYYESNSTVDSDAVRFMSKGVNFGSVDGTVLTEGTNSLLLQGLHRQITMVYDTIQMLQLALGWEKALQITSEAIFWLSFGKDDYVNLIMQDSFGLIPKYGRRGFAEVLVPQIIQGMEDLYNAGVRKMVVVGIPPLGCSPWAAFEKRNCVEEMNDLVKDYNALLSLGVRDLNREIPDASLVFCDVYAGMMEIIANPQLYGFEVVNNPCCGLKSLVGLIGCLSEEMACNTPYNFVWWDLYSPTTAVNSLLAQWAWSGEDHWRICRSKTLKLLASNEVRF